MPRQYKQIHFVLGKIIYTYVLIVVQINTVLYNKSFVLLVRVYSNLIATHIFLNS